ncbi:hypothetical protein BCV69DRAFT_180805 [Microstroma glucosiphilum]|uniref:Uncharacterized protein n=1 Tax=Pseudomicrostroma glucosiphilum TaxID=1684307 RepID=A0A316UD64_9BASI|nr:hypothetical protein BCV69DRAFT_180805 [Pseudomicrostroma glucosiphilum]PWN20995.1 hypothetical protein BCV69DRAFT_180805 [Pseudomicrostroma glucosiphilum]
MDLLVQVLLCLVFILSLALYFQLASGSQQPSSGSGSGKGSSSKSKSKKKSKKASVPAQASAAQPTETKASDRPVAEGGAFKARDVPTPPAASASDEVVPVREEARHTSKLAQTEEDISQSSESSNRAAASKSSSLSQIPDAGAETVDLAYFQEQSDRRRERPVEDAWQSVGKGAARLSKPVQSCESMIAQPSRCHTDISGSPPRCSFSSFHFLLLHRIQQPFCSSARRWRQACSCSLSKHQHTSQCKQQLVQDSGPHIVPDGIFVRCRANKKTTAECCSCSCRQASKRRRRENSSSQIGSSQEGSAAGKNEGRGAQEVCEGHPKLRP